MDTKLDKNVSTTTKESKTEFSETSCSSSNVTEDESNLEYLASYNEVILVLCTIYNKTKYYKRLIKFKSLALFFTTY